MADQKNAAVLGASGYTGAEAIRLIANHPKLSLKALTAHSRAGQALSASYPNFTGMNLPELCKWEDVNFDEIDVVFACLPHGASQDTIAQIRGRVGTVIDLSADFRLKDPNLYAETYGRTHDFPELLEGAVYGLTEYARANLPGADLVACPGCYPTCSLLSLLPGFEADLFDPHSVIIDAKSGVTGAGRKASEALIYSEIADGAHAYSVGNHRHAPEIDQMLNRVSGQAVKVSFTPHLIPMNRGMITTSYLKLQPGVSIEDVKAAYERKYADEPFIHLMDTAPHTRHVRGSNRFHMGIFADRVEGQIIIIGVLDNLTKGSSGQAVQNYNLTQGWDETLGLVNLPLFP